MSRGFTLIELLIVVVIAAILLGLAVPRLRPALDRVATDAAARDVPAALAPPRHPALARRKKDASMRVGFEMMKRG